MKVLILSCSTGGGHDSAAKALIEQFKIMNIECKMIDSIELTNKKFSKKVNKTYVDIVTNKPKMFKTIYHMGELYGKLKIKSPVYEVNALFSKNLEEYIINNKFDYIIATHLYPAETLTYIKKRNSNIHFAVVATDYVCIPFWEETNPDYYIIPCKNLKNDFINKGISGKKLLSFGIPISPKFQNKYSKKESRNQLSLPHNKKIILIMSGSMGYGNIDNIIDKLLGVYNNKVLIIAICGNNKKLKQNLDKKYKNKILTKDYTTNINIYMNACDVILTKPGGLTSTEAAIANIPIVFTNPIPGCENYNAEFFQKKGMAFCLRNEEDIIKYLDILLSPRDCNLLIILIVFSLCNKFIEFLHVL